MPSIVDISLTVPPRRRLLSSGAARPGGLESLIWSNGLVLNNQEDNEQYYVKSVDGLWGAEIRDQREPKVNDDGEDVYDTLLGGKLVTISGHIDAYTLDRMRDMEQALEKSFPHDYDYPIVFDRSALRQAGMASGATIDRNWCINPSFENDTAHWSTNVLHELNRRSDFFTANGEWHAEVTFHPGDFSYDALDHASPTVVTQDEYFQVAIDVYMPDDWDGGAVSIFGSAAKNNGIDWGEQDETPLVGLSSNVNDSRLRNRWQRIWAVYQWRDVENADTVTLNVQVGSEPTEGRKLYFDAASIRVFNSMNINEPTYFDGESAGWLWDGDIHESSSRPDPDAYRQNVFIVARRIDKIGLRDEQTNQWYKRDFQIALRMPDPCIYSTKTKTVSNPPPLVNLATNPSFETNTVGWTVLGTGSPFPSSVWASRGTKSLRASSSSAGVVGLQIPTGTGGIPIPGGRTYSASIDVNYAGKSNGASGGKLFFDMYFYNAAGTIITGSTAAETIVAGIQTLKIENIVSPGTARFMQVRVYTSDNVNAAVLFYIDGLMINEGPTVLDYFDGSTPGVGLVSWAGAVNNSSSSRVLGFNAKNHGNYNVKPRLLITGPWTNFGITNSVLLPGETVARKFSFTGIIPAGVTVTWDEETSQLVDSTGASRDGQVDAAANGLRLGPECTSIFTLAGSGLSVASGVALSWEDTWK